MSDFANISMAIATIVSLVYIARQVNDTRRQAKGQFLLALDERFDKFSNIHNRLFDSDRPFDPSTEEGVSWPEVWQYIGLFERINVMLDDEILDESVVLRFYGYRIHSIIINDTLYAQILDNPETWQDFIALCRRLSRFTEHKSQAPFTQEFRNRVENLHVISA